MLTCSFIVLPGLVVSYLMDSYLQICVIHYALHYKYSLTCSNCPAEFQCLLHSSLDNSIIVFSLSLILARMICRSVA